MPNYLVKDWFKETPDGVRLVGSQCQDCNKTYFPKKILCQGCFSENLEDVIISNKGKLHAFTNSIMGPPALEKPYIQSLIEMPEGFKLFSLLTDVDADKLEIDMDLEMTLGKVNVDEEGNDVISYKFRPAKTEGAS